MNSKASRKLEVSNCLRYWGPLRAEVVSLISAFEQEIAAITSDYVPESRREELNKKISGIIGLRQVLLLEEQLKEELHPNEETASAFAASNAD